MKCLAILALVGTSLLLPNAAFSQQRGQVVHVYEAGNRKIVTGRLVEVSDSSIFVVKRSSSRDTVQVCCNEIYSIKAHTRLAETIGSGLLNGTFITIMVADNQRRESSVNSLQTEWTGEAYYDALTGTAAGLIMDVSYRKEPIIIHYSYDRFRAFAPDLKQFVEERRRIDLPAQAPQ